ncbi:MAG: MBL fold metallo-hydrolase [Oscillospiraceae bacterium]|nr:MBL fold metallo-hydrolase [Oscillospiraceae bacterium]
MKTYVQNQVKPFRMIGNIYYVGTDKFSCHMIDTGEGLILIDTGAEENAPMIVDSLSQLGYDVADVKYIVHSHGHFDHSHATAEIVRLSGAKTWLHKDDVQYLKGLFVPDHYTEHGDVLTLGNTRIEFIHAPGHTLGTVAFFFDVEENGVTYRAGMFGGAGVNQLKKGFLRRYGLSYFLRDMFFKTLEMLKNYQVDVPLGNHPYHTHTLKKAALAETAETNPFIDPQWWAPFMDKLGAKLREVLKEEAKEKFVNYAHRGASQYAPENTIMAFDLGLSMGANGIETDIQLTKDGVPVLFHDNTLARMTGKEGSVADYTYEELRWFWVEKGILRDRIPTLQAFLERYADKDITFALELKTPGTYKAVADAVRSFGIRLKTVVTSFNYEELLALRAYAPELSAGYLTKTTDEEILENMRRDGIDELCPKAEEITAEKVDAWHEMGFNVRAWGVADTALMERAYTAGVNGMTVNFPDELTALTKEN